MGFSGMYLDCRKITNERFEKGGLCLVEAKDENGWK